MGTARCQGGCWPTKEQQLLLRAALLQGSEAINAWNMWKSVVDVVRSDPGSQRLFPLLYQNLLTHEMRDPLMNRLGGTYRLTWYKNQTLFHNATPLLRSFHNAGIETMILKGAVMTLLYYKDYGLRLADDFGILVRAERAQEAIDILTGLDWVTRSPVTLTASCFPTRHAYVFENIAGHRVVLQWHLLPDCCYADVDRMLWERAIPTELHGVSTRALNPTDQLLQTCAQGAAWSLPHLPQWAADAMMILRAPDTKIDWDRLADQAQERGLTLQLLDSWHYLRDQLSAPVPPDILERAQDIPASRIERMEHRFRTHPPRLLGGLPRIWFCFLRTVQTTDKTIPWFRLASFPRFLQHTWALDHLWQVPFCIISKGIRRIWTITFGER
jgi:hypothetical protein